MNDIHDLKLMNKKSKIYKVFFFSFFFTICALKAYDAPIDGHQIEN